MRKSVWTTVIALTLVLGYMGVSMAEEGNARKGKYLYRKVYTTCSERGEADSPKPKINPDAKTQEQWKRVFESKNFEEFGCRQEWSALSEQDLNDIFTYLHEHAADSPTPAKCN